MRNTDILRDIEIKHSAIQRWTDQVQASVPVFMSMLGPKFKPGRPVCNLNGDLKTCTIRMPVTEGDEFGGIVMTVKDGEWKWLPNN